MKRRTFLQQAGLALLALGVSETALSLLGEDSFAVPLLDRYYQALAQPSARKLALLVGINQYPRGTALSGCVTDVEMQRELLIHRFGFNARDILTLTDTQATRENIETGFLEHLTKQAAAGDVVVFHFSGYGSRVTINEEQDSAIQNSLVPVDGTPNGKGAAAANYLLEETLLLLLRSLSTDQVTTILDTSYANAGTVLQGNLRIRSCPSLFQDQLSPGELAFQEQLLLKINASREQLKKQLNSGQLPGIVLAAAGPSQPATEAPWGGFSAGLFTYALTQHLWQAAPPTTVQVSVSRAAGVVEQLVGNQQQPTVMGQQSREGRLLAYHLTPDPSTCADGVVTAVEENGKTAHLWLAGLPATVLEYYGVNSLLTLSGPKEAIYESPLPETSNSEQGAAPPTPTQAPQLQIRSKEGLVARARVVGLTENYNLLPGQLVQESIRVLPRNVSLTVALDARLERIERVDATSAFANVASVSSVVAAGEQPADYLFGREQVAIANGVTDISADVKDSEKTSAISFSQGGYGLFSLGRDPIPNTTGQVGEAVKVAVNRLTPKLKTLLAAKLWRLTANEGSSRLFVSATLERVSPTKQVLMQRETLRSRSFSKRELPREGSQPRTEAQGNPLPVAPRSSPSDSISGIPALAIGNRIQYRIQNNSNQPIYVLVLGIDSSSNAIAVYPPQSSPATSEIGVGFMDAMIPEGATITVPQSSEWVVQGPAGIVQTQLICSCTPFTQTLAALAVAQRAKREQEQVGELFNPLDIARALLQDLHEASTLAKRDANPFLAPETIAASSDTYVLDVNSWATFCFVYQVV